LTAFFNLTNFGVAAAFGRAVDLSKGEYVGLLGADDALVAEAVEIMVDTFKKYPNCSLINSNSYHCDPELKVQGIYLGFRPIPRGVALIDHLSVCNFAAFRRSAYDQTEGFNPTFRKAADHDLFLKLDEVGELRYVNRPLYYYRVTGAGLSQGENGIRAAQFSAIARMHAQKRRIKSGKGTVMSRKSYNNLASVYHMRQAALEQGFVNRFWHLVVAVRYDSALITNGLFWRRLFAVNAP
jgi:glycosyltransferase involved in cell wall biosynthesis